MLVDSNERELENQEIVLEAARGMRDKRYTPDQVLASLIKEVEQKNTILMRQGNTLFIVRMGKDRIAFFNALNADIPANYLENSLMFAKAAYLAGIDILVTDFTDSTILNIFKYIERNRNRVNPDKDGKMTMGYATQKIKMKDGTPGYRVTAVLGPRRGGKAK